MRALWTVHRRNLTAVVVLTLALAPCAARADDIDLYRQTLKSSGWVLTPTVGNGSCWVVDREHKLVLTNLHVVDNIDDVIVRFPKYLDGTLLTDAKDYLTDLNTAVHGRVLFRDAKRDLALVRLETLPDGVAALSLAPTSAKVGDHVLSVGNSGLAGKPVEQGQLWMMRVGRVKDKQFRVLQPTGAKSGVEMSMINSTVDSHPGDSGGPVVNERGELVGVTSCGNHLNSFAIDVTEVRAFLKNAAYAQRGLPTGTLMAGSWTVSFNTDGAAPVKAGLTLRPDGTCTWEEKDAHEGTYNYAGGRLTLRIEGRSLEVAVDVTWATPDQVRFADGKVEYTMNRR
jgi:S1-C subfamily serine protease